MAVIDTFKWCTQVQNNGAAMTVTNNDREVIFGNGYKQLASGGFNTERRSFSIVYAGLDYQEVRDFMRSHRLKPFIWKMPDGDLGLFVVKSDSLSATVLASDAQELKCTFEEQFTSMN